MNTARGSRSILHRPRRAKKSRDSIQNDDLPPPEQASNTLASSIKKHMAKLTSHPSSEAEPASTALISTTSPSTPGFTLFPELPEEIRIKIFVFGLLLPRVQIQKQASLSGSNHFIDTVANISVWPPLLHTCRESRKEAVMFYDGIKGDGGMFKSDRNTVPRRMGYGDIRGRKRIKAAGYWWDAAVVEEEQRGEVIKVVF